MTGDEKVESQKSRTSVSGLVGQTIEKRQNLDPKLTPQKLNFKTRPTVVRRNTATPPITFRIGCNVYQNNALAILYSMELYMFQLNT